MRTTCAAIALALLAACSSPGEDAAPSTSPADEPAPSATPSRGDDAGGSSGATFKPAAVDLELRPVAGGFEAPLIVTNAVDGSNRLFVGEQGGRIWIVAAGERASTPFLDVSSRIVAGGEQGLLGLAFHPGFEDNGRFFVNYTDTDGDTVVAEYRASGESADADSERVLLTIDQPFPNHNGGALAFGEDGYLYIATGDGGSAGDPDGNGQDLGTLLGKMLRIDVDEETSSRPYGIPEDNPFVDREGARPEIWAYGLRNPWRFVFDREADTLWTADVGQGALEEVNAAPADEAGLNYGWDVMEGTDCFEAYDCDRSGKVLPVAEYGHEFGCSVTGGPVYRGERFPDMQGGYFFGDYCSGIMWALPAERPNSRPLVEILRSDAAISSFGVDEAGEMYLTDHASGQVLHLVDES
jgi:glucose/arabinose dehydrogenase